MSKTIVGLFNSTAEATKVKENLIANGFESDQIRVVANDAHDEFFNVDSSGCVGINLLCGCKSLTCQTDTIDALALQVIDTAAVAPVPDLGTVHFDTNKATLTPEGQATLQQAAAATFIKNRDQIERCHRTT